jgi:hypothetical protein
MEDDEPIGDPARFDIESTEKPPLPEKSPLRLRQ